MEYIQIGKIVNAVALRGEVKVYHYSDYKERFEELERILVRRKKDYEPYEIEKVRYQKGMVILKLKGVDDRNGAEALKESDIFITEADLRELPEDTFYVRDLIGCKVYDGAKYTAPGASAAAGDAAKAGAAEEDAACAAAPAEDAEGAEKGAYIGEITDVLQNTAQDIYQVRTADGREVLIPAVGDFIREVSIVEKYVLVTLIPGFLD